MIPPAVRVSTPNRFDPCGDPCGGVHSYTASGTRWCWTTGVGGRDAIDVETLAEVPPAFARVFDRPLAEKKSFEFWQAWTALEVIAKLKDIPILTLVGQGKLGATPPVDITLCHFIEGDTVGCLGTLEVGAE